MKKMELIEAEKRKKQKIYVVFYSDYEGGYIDSIFSNKKDAVKWCRKLKSNNYSVDEWEMNEEIKNINVKHYTGYISEGLIIDSIENTTHNRNIFDYSEPKKCVGNKRYAISVWAKSKNEAIEKIKEKYKAIAEVSDEKNKRKSHKKV